jgi:hypothetical protein
MAIDTPATEQTPQPAPVTFSETLRTNAEAVKAEAAKRGTVLTGDDAVAVIENTNKVELGKKLNLDVAAILSNAEAPQSSLAQTATETQEEPATPGPSAETTPAAEPLPASTPVVEPALKIPINANLGDNDNWKPGDKYFQSTTPITDALARQGLETPKAPPAPEVPPIAEVAMTETAPAAEPPPTVDSVVQTAQAAAINNFQKKRYDFKTVQPEKVNKPNIISRLFGGLFGNNKSQTTTSKPNGPTVKI